MMSDEIVKAGERSDRSDWSNVQHANCRMMKIVKMYKNQKYEN